MVVASMVFQSTRPWGRELPSYVMSHILLSFNPRARGGANTVCGAKPVIAIVSIHAPVGARTTHERAIEPSRSFNPRARGGANVARFDQVASVSQFQSTRPWGRERPELAQLRALMVSIHAPVGART